MPISNKKKTVKNFFVEKKVEKFSVRWNAMLKEKLKVEIEMTIAVDKTNTTTELDCQDGPTKTECKIGRKRVVSSCGEK